MYEAVSGYGGDAQVRLGDRTYMYARSRSTLVSHRH